MAYCTLCKNKRFHNGREEQIRGLSATVRCFATISFDQARPLSPARFLTGQIQKSLLSKFLQWNQIVPASLLKVLALAERFGTGGHAAAVLDLRGVAIRVVFFET